MIFFSFTAKKSIYTHTEYSFYQKCRIVNVYVRFSIWFIQGLTFKRPFQKINLHMASSKLQMWLNVRFHQKSGSHSLKKRSISPQLPISAKKFCKCWPFVHLWPSLNLNRWPDISRPSLCCATFHPLYKNRLQLRRKVQISLS